MSDDERIAQEGAQAGLADPELATELARHLAEIATVMLAPGGATTAAQRVRSLALVTLDGCDDAGLCAVSDLEALPHASALVAGLEALQAETGEGPCVDTLGGLDAVYVPDLLDDSRWPSFSAGAAALGVRTALAFRLANEGQTVGALQLFAQLPAAFNATERAQGLIFASYAGLALALANAKAVEGTRIENLEAALRSREVIGQAQGILMERERITADQAFQLLRRSSQHLNLKLRTVAQGIVDTGALPSGSVPPGA